MARNMPVVLVADADPDLSDLIRLFLVGRGYAVETVSEASECLERLRRRPPDVLVLERELFQGGGDDILAYLRQAGPSPLPAVVLTTGAPVDRSERAVAPVVACLRKPFHLVALLESIAASPGVHRPTPYPLVVQPHFSR